ncbi:hypothetical protein NDU88_001963 [Pleurodeles waltl]|uniref:Uncharacterized protein n=1 Tax=Pleurodeles waltl TaxID=8319 RepID=A0AAV7R9H8_PLEWA|nr:hypothetical protein NDU88_001963 [Pleurodeles waltl]
MASGSCGELRGSLCCLGELPCLGWTERWPGVERRTGGESWLQGVGKEVVGGYRCRDGRSRPCDLPFTVARDISGPLRGIPPEVEWAHIVRSAFGLVLACRLTADRSWDMGRRSAPVVDGLVKPGGALQVIPRGGCWVPSEEAS